MKKVTLWLLIASLVALIGYACDTGSDEGVCTEAVSSVSNTREARLYYPCNISGAVGATTMSSGYTGTYSDVEWLSEAVAKAGYVVLAFTPTSEWGMVSGWRDAHKSCIAELKDINANHRVLQGKIDTGKLSTCGHSKGGGGSLWASSQLRGELKTTVGMAPYEEGFVDSTLNSVSAATFIQAGANDTLATNSMTRGEYSGLGDISKMYVEYTGYDHLAWASATGSTAARLSGDIIAWMKYYLDGDTSYAGTLSNQSGTSRYDWVDLGTTGGGDTGIGDTINGTYSIIAQHSGKALDVWEWGTTDGTNIVQYDYWGGDAQQFVITPVDGIWHRITPLIASDQALDVTDCSTAAGANVQTWSYLSNNCQLFRFESTGDGAYYIINRNSGMCLDVLDASTEDGANVIQYNCLNGAQHQLFELVVQ